jgi:predicted nucleic acid-binding protein
LKFLIDTNVASELGRARPDRTVVAWLSKTAPEDQYLSVLTLGEIARGIASIARRDQSRSASLQIWLDGLKDSYGDRIIDVDQEIAEHWGVLNAKRSMPAVDSLLAATALVHGMTLVTRNIRDIADTGVKVLNPWDE